MITTKNCLVYKILLAWLWLLIISPQAVSKEDSDKASTLTFENDFFADQDGGYTNGIAYSWVHSEAKNNQGLELPDWIEFLNKQFELGEGFPNKALTYTLFQVMQTPEDLSATELQVDDVPYVGALGWKGTLHAWDETDSQQYSLLIGMTGPASLAERTQRLVHSITGSEKPLGWHNQIHNELGFTLTARYSKRLLQFANEQGHEVDLIGAVEGNGGTFLTAGGASLIVRYGTQLERTHHLASLLPGRDVNPLAGSVEKSFYWYFGLNASYVINDIMMDGNTFRNSHSVPLKHERWSVATGIAYNWKHLGLLFTIAQISSPTKLSSKKERYGSFSISYRF